MNKVKNANSIYSLNQIFSGEKIISKLNYLVSCFNFVKNLERKNDIQMKNS